MEEAEEQKTFKYVTLNVLKDTLLALNRRDYRDKEMVINTVNKETIETDSVKVVLNHIKENRVRYITINGDYRGINLFIVADFIGKFIYLTADRSEYAIKFVDSLAS